MSTTPELPTELLNVVIENQDGVCEYQLRVTYRDSGILLKTHDVRVLSGVSRPIAPERIIRALRLEHWADQHAAVFTECRVSP